MADDTPQLQDLEYEYKPRWSSILLGVLLCGTGTTVAAALAVSNFGLRIWGIRLPPEIAAGTWWTLAVTSLGGGFLFLLMAGQRMFRTQRIVLTPAAIFVPKGRFSSKVVMISFSAITDLSVSQVYSQRFLKITHHDGTATIVSSWLPERDDFDVVHKMLAEQVEASRQGIKALHYQQRPDSAGEEAEAAIAREYSGELYVVPIRILM